MKTRSNHTPDYKALEFTENPNRKGTYDLQPNQYGFTKFKYFMLQEPKQSYLIEQGAKHVCESWEHGKKTLHTGLIHTDIENYYFGDYREPYKGKFRSSIIIFHLVPKTTVIRLYYFNHYSKKSKALTVNFCKDFIKTIVKKEVENLTI
jgi:hypothetical protein